MFLATAIFSEMFGMFVGGAVHWITAKPLGLKEDCVSVIAFDLGVESYREFPMPPKLENRRVGCMSLVVFGECLSIVDNYPNDRIDLWVMNDYGVKNTWSKLFSVEQPTLVKDYSSIRLCASSKSSKDILLQVGNKAVYWYNLETHKVKHSWISKSRLSFDLAVYGESLVKLCNDSDFEETLL